MHAKRDNVLRLAAARALHFLEVRESLRGPDLERQRQAEAEHAQQAIP